MPPLVAPPGDFRAKGAAMIVQPNQTVYLPPQSSTWAFIDCQSLGEQTGITVGGNIYVVSANPYVLTVDLPFSGLNIPFVNTGPAAVDICLRPPNVDPWWGLGPGKG
jgi:hypothetical protein